ncbi:Coiled-coil domain-containing protein 25 [Tulasnella sp. 425]|nr:Coiled-coil domain-containing protein 25 [Tulasnella sp. 425]
MGKDKVENEDLIKYGTTADIWFHVDKLSSAHVYLKLPPGVESWENIPQTLLVDCAQLVKANSIEGNKKSNITVIYTPWDNLKKTGDMAVGQVAFHNDKRVKRVHVPQRENFIVNRLNKTKVEREVDHEQEKIERQKVESAVRRAAAAEQKKAEQELARQRAAEKEARSYDRLFEGVDEEDLPQKSVQEMEDDFM